MIDFLLQLTLPVSLLLILLIATQQLLLKRLGAATMYALWATVPLLLLISMLLSHVALPVDTLLVKRYQVSLQQASIVVQGANWLLWFWLAGISLCLSFLLLSFLNNRALLKRAKPLQLTSVPIKCWLADNDAGPFITGFMTPCILLPQDFFTRFSSVQQQLILQHEQTHWRRGDLHLNYLALIVVSVFWFNPLVWLGYRQYRQAQELACDALVIRDAGKEEKIAYGYALLSSTQQAPQYWCPLIHYYGDFNTMKQRIMHLKNQKGLSKAAVAAVMALVVAFTLLIQQPVLAGSNKVQQLVPVKRIEPRYPIQAAEQGISGFVVLKFDVTAKGDVTNAQVIKSEPSQVFDKESLRALQQWQYNATGEAHKDLMVQLDFELDVIEPGIERISVTPPAPPKG
ncbi:TonB family protein [Arsukibacterium sp.]|uniref:M56 family metallopeptidase n=1 Tax=Arsukibacterium sp. TaxID=1977258 RepID=UPI003566D02F